MRRLAVEFTKKFLANNTIERHTSHNKEEQVHLTKFVRCVNWKRIYGAHESLSMAMTGEIPM